MFVTGQQEVHTLCRKLRQMYLMDGKQGKSHRILPEGGILLLETGQQEVHTLCRKLRCIPWMASEVNLIEYSLREVLYLSQDSRKFTSCVENSDSCIPWMANQVSLIHL